MDVADQRGFLIDEVAWSDSTDFGEDGDEEALLEVIKRNGGGEGNH